jgi:hypothetical protein
MSMNRAVTTSNGTDAALAACSLRSAMNTRQDTRLPSLRPRCTKGNCTNLAAPAANTADGHSTHLASLWSPGFRHTSTRFPALAQERTGAKAVFGDSSGLAPHDNVVAVTPAALALASAATPLTASVMTATGMDAAAAALTCAALAAAAHTAAAVIVVIEPPGAEHTRGETALRVMAMMPAPVTTLVPHGNTWEEGIERQIGQHRVYQERAARSPAHPAENALDLSASRLADVASLVL